MRRSFPCPWCGCWIADTHKLDTARDVFLHESNVRVIRIYNWERETDGSVADLRESGCADGAGPDLRS